MSSLIFPKKKIRMLSAKILLCALKIKNGNCLIKISDYWKLFEYQTSSCIKNFGYIVLPFLLLRQSFHSEIYFDKEFLIK